MFLYQLDKLDNTEQLDITNPKAAFDWHHKKITVTTSIFLPKSLLKHRISICKRVDMSSDWSWKIPSGVEHASIEISEQMKFFLGESPATNTELFDFFHPFTDLKAEKKAVADFLYGYGGVESE